MTCKYCSRTIDSRFQFCPYCGEKITAENHDSKDIKKDYIGSNNSEANRFFTILMLVFIFPYGLPYMWITRPFTKKTRWIISLAFILTSLLGFIMIIVGTTLPQ